jgi:hypothetical protein
VKFLTSYFDKAIALLAAQQGGQLRIPIPRSSAQAEAEESTPSDPGAAEEGITADVAPTAPGAEAT